MRKGDSHTTGFGCPKTLVGSVEEKAMQRPDGVCFLEQSGLRWTPITHGQFLKDVRRLAQALRAQGIRKGDRVAILSRPCYLWEVADKAAMYAGAVSVGLDVHHSNEELAHVIRLAEPRAYFFEDAAVAEKIDRHVLEASAMVCLLNSKVDSAKGPWTDLQSACTRFDAGDAGPSVAQPDDLAALIFTSGTTGQPKGIPLRHRHLTAGLPVVREIFEAPLRTTESHRTLAWMPMPSISARMLGAINYHFNVAQYFVPDPKTIIDKIHEVQPTFLLVVPRIFEKVHQAIQTKLADWPRHLRLLLKLLVSMRKHLPTLGGRFLADRLLLERLRRGIWGNAMQFLLTGSAPADPKVLRFFDGLGTPTLEVYAMSELGCIISANRFDNIRYGSVGRPLSNMEVKIASDGEVLLRSETVVDGYWQGGADSWRDKDGWFRTGDLGCIQSGCLYLTGRKREIIKTSTGRNVSPAAVEQVYQRVSGVDRVVVIGDNRPSLCGIVTVDGHLAKDLARRGSSVAEYLASEFKAREGELASYLRIRRWLLLDEPFSVASGQITTSMKIRRQIVARQYRNEIDALYRRRGDAFSIIQEVEERTNHAERTDHGLNWSHRQ